MGKGVIQSVGGGGGCAPAACWSNILCYSIIPDPGLLAVYREVNGGGNPAVGVYDPYTWSPNAPYPNPTLVSAPAFVHNTYPVINMGNAYFNSDYSILFSFINTNMASSPYPSSASLIGVNVSDPSNPFVEYGPVTIDSANSGYTVDSLAIDPTTNKIYIYSGNYNASDFTHLRTIDPVTGDVLTTGPSLGIGYAYYVLGFDLSGQMYVFARDGTCKLANKSDGSFGATLWTLPSGQYVYNFMGYAGSGYYGVSIYDSNLDIYYNKIIDLSAGTVIDTLTGVKRGVFYNPSTIPPVYTKFVRVFTKDCEGNVTFTNNDFVTGEEIVIPEGATISVCA